MIATEEEVKAPPIHWVGKETLTAPVADTPAQPLIAPDHAKGCEKCSFGLIEPPKTLGAFPMYVERRAQFMAGALTFCKCRAGQLYRAHMVILSHKAPEEM